ncbi:expressed unknown protein [Seminavis robusta]|uniref:Uncharacterized protein n=1 Tax=Seminavis robusta TaxID=568900 RepID=A0A9N8ELZ4_9STRA|nr:expressed unknown protein [Seminavis robusta]|eukprot:Sro1432_g272080.1 n/a (272) ;mRNA; f:1373-2292
MSYEAKSESAAIGASGSDDVDLLVPVSLGRTLRAPRNEQGEDDDPILLENGVLPTLLPPDATEQENGKTEGVKSTKKANDSETSTKLEDKLDVCLGNAEWTMCQDQETPDGASAVPEGLEPCALVPADTHIVQEIITPTSQPGAFASYPGGRASRVLSYALMPDEGSDDPEATATHTIESSRHLQDHSGLAEATPVSHENPAASLPGAVPFDRERLQTERTKKDRRQLLGLGAILLVTLVVIVVVVIAVTSPDDPNSQMETRDPLWHLARV